MTPTLTAGLLLGVLCGVWTFVMGLTGWYKDPGKTSASLVIVAIEIAVLLWGLGRTAMKEGRTYSGQVVAGTLMSIIGGAVIIGFSLLFTNVFFPNYFSDMQPVYRDLLQKQGMPEAEIATAMAEWSAGQSSIRQAVGQFLFTFVTGVVVSAVLAIWVRARPVLQQVARNT
jgi:TM2 domain-containing membrane protein YozV